MYLQAAENMPTMSIASQNPTRLAFFLKTPNVKPTYFQPAVAEMETAAIRKKDEPQGQKSKAKPQKREADEDVKTKKDPSPKSRQSRYKRAKTWDGLPRISGKHVTNMRNWETDHPWKGYVVSSRG